MISKILLSAAIGICVISPHKLSASADNSEVTKAPPTFSKAFNTLLGELQDIDDKDLSNKIESFNTDESKAYFDILKWVEESHEFKSHHIEYILKAITDERLVEKLKSYNIEYRASTLRAELPEGPDISSANKAQQTSKLRKFLEIINTYANIVVQGRVSYIIDVHLRNRLLTDEQRYKITLMRLFEPGHKHPITSYDEIGMSLRYLSNLPGYILQDAIMRIKLSPNMQIPPATAEESTNFTLSFPEFNQLTEDLIPQMSDWEVGFAITQQSGFAIPPETDIVKTTQANTYLPNIGTVLTVGFTTLTVVLLTHSNGSEGNTSKDNKKGEQKSKGNC